MFGAIRRGDFVVKTCPFRRSGPFYTSSLNSFVDGRGQVRLGDKSVPGICISGSSSVFVDGRPAAHFISKVICGRIAQCSSTIFIGS
jgi:uncharacterized Zn-binding protein involved in type VI secretion